MKPMTMQAERTVMAMPGRQGAMAWTDRAKTANQVALVEDDELPFMTNAFDRIIAAHLLEVSDNQRAVLAELSRVLQPEGQLLLVVPNRLGVWARTENTPFGLGSPFTPGQITRLLENSGFHVETVSQCLFFPPLQQRAMLKLASSLDRWVRPFAPAGGGALLINARKRVHAPIKRPGLAQRLPSLWGWVPKPALGPATSRPPVVVAPVVVSPVRNLSHRSQLKTPQLQGPEKRAPSRCHD